MRIILRRDTQVQGFTDIVSLTSPLSLRDKWFFWPGRKLVTLLAFSPIGMKAEANSNSLDGNHCRES